MPAKAGIQVLLLRLCGDDAWIPAGVYPLGGGDDTNGLDSGLSRNDIVGG